MGTRQRPTTWERDLLGAIGAHLSRARAWDLPAAQRGEKANDRVKLLVARFGIHSRYAGSICVDNDAAVRACKELLWAHQRQLQDAVRLLERRVALPSKAALCGCRQRRCEACGKGYPTEHERVMKRHRLDVLRAELTRVEAKRANKDWSVVLGGRRLANTRHHLDAAGLSTAQWQQQWRTGRAWLGSVGNTGVLGGNPCLSLRQDDPGRPGAWFLTVSVPTPVQARFGCGSQVRLTNPVPLAHHRAEVEGRLHDRQAVRLDVNFEVDGKARERALLRIAWVRPAREVLTMQQARQGGLVSVDLNADHLAAARVDQAGNPVGQPVVIPMVLENLPASTRDARLREAISALIRHTQASGARAIAIAATAGLTVVVVDPRYTSKVGGRDWRKVLAGGSCTPHTRKTNVTVHQGAAVAIGRRALALGLKAGTQPVRTARVPEARSVPHQRDPLSPGSASRRDGSASSPAAQVRAPGSSARPVTRTRAGAHAAHHSPGTVLAPIPDAASAAPGCGPGETPAGVGRTPRIGPAAPAQPPG